MKSLISFLAVTALSVVSFAAEVTGVPNFHQVNDHVYRGAQPSPQGFQNLSKLGIRTVIDLRESDSRSKAEQKIVEAGGMRYVNIPLKGLGAPSEQDVAKLLAMFEDSSAGPIFIHCRRGADRTGTVCACYRIAHDHWENAKALQEARTFGMSWMEKAMQQYVLHYQAATSVASAPAAVAATAVAVSQ
ncbi:MAG TPA: tyrosine-protein phosphatase [Bryobacteraceae bacterium]